MKKKQKQNLFMSTVKVGTKGQIVIPKEIRDMFDIESGDSLIIMADVQKGIALQKASVLSEIAEAIFKGEGKNLYPAEEEEGLQTFAEEIRKHTDSDEG